VSVAAFGVSEVGVNLRNLQNRSVAGMRRGVRRFLDTVGEQSQVQVPRITGALARSMRIRIQENPVSGIISYDMPYAGIVHEIPRPPESNGKWKYLEDPFMKELRSSRAWSPLRSSQPSTVVAHDRHVRRG